MLTISKDKSTLIKGIAISMMIFLHLFSGNHTNLCTNLFFIGDEPFSKWLSNACGPIDFFLILSGYGLAYTFENGDLSLNKQLRRVFRLYFHYWIVLLIFVSIGSFLVPLRYPGSWTKLILNLVCWEYGYNEEMWFLFPYCIICLNSTLIIRFAQRLGAWQSIAIVCFIHLFTCYVISRYGPGFLYLNELYYKPIQILHFLYAFTVGVIFYQTRQKYKIVLPSWVALFSIIVLVSVVATFGNAVLYMLYVPLMVILFCQLSYPRWLECILMELGRKSMPMWMIHTWYCYYLFQSQVYGLRYPLFIFLVVVLLSYCTSVLIMWITKKSLTIMNF